MERFLLLWDEIDELAGGLRLWLILMAADLRDLRTSVVELFAGPRDDESVSTEA